MLLHHPRKIMMRWTIGLIGINYVIVEARDQEKGNLNRNATYFYSMFLLLTHRHG